MMIFEVLEGIMGYYDSYYDQAVKEAEDFAAVYVTIWLVVFFAIAAVLAALIVSTIIALKKRADKQKAVNAATERELVAFAPTRVFYFCDRATYKKSNDFKQILAVDSKNDRLGLVDYESGKFKIIHYSQILNYEVYENGSVVASGLGVGGVVGAFSMQASKIVKELRLIIRLKTVDEPQIVYQVVASKGVFNLGIGKNSQIYRLCYPTVQEAVSLLQVIINQNKETNKN